MTVYNGDVLDTEAVVEFLTNEARIYIYIYTPCYLKAIFIPEHRVEIFAIVSKCLVELRRICIV